MLFQSKCISTTPGGSGLFADRKFSELINKTTQSFDVNNNLRKELYWTFINCKHYSPYAFPKFSLAIATQSFDVKQQPKQKIE